MKTLLSKSKLLRLIIVMSLFLTYSCSTEDDLLIETPVSEKETILVNEKEVIVDDLQIKNRPTFIEETVRAEINKKLPYRKRINRRKTLIIHSAKKVDIDFSKDKVIIELDATLKRKIRRDARGTITASANFSINVIDRSICLSNLKITKVKLSRTTRLGEALYRFVANKVLPNNQCIDF